MARAFGLLLSRSPTPTTRAGGTFSRGPCHRSRRLADEALMERFLCCFDPLGAASGGRQVDAIRIATCTAAEMALHLVIDAA